MPQTHRQSGRTIPGTVEIDLYTGTAFHLRGKANSDCVTQSQHIDCSKRSPTFYAGAEFQARTRSRVVPFRSLGFGVFHKNVNGTLFDEAKGGSGLRVYL